MNSFLVIGAGRMGSRLAEQLMLEGNEVMLLDRNEDKAQKLADVVTAVKIGDCTDMDTLREIGVNNFDYCIVCISKDFEASMMITAVLKELGAQKVVARASSNFHARLLKKIGADEVIFPEQEVADHLAVRYTRNRILDYFKLTEDYQIMEVEVPYSWVGKTVGELQVRSRYGINIIGIRSEKGFDPVIDVNDSFGEKQTLIVGGTEKQLRKIYGN
ncbi:MAG: TrkA family potassium uptake protein [Erysipelotrichaceae bacterium]|nr:TrkA family potassium uptake protein [Erysipelotrichaceae bacterium]